MSDCGGNPEKCKMCGKKGLPILLTRYAVATRDTTKWYTGKKGGKEDFLAVMRASGAPEISGDFVKPTIDLGESAYYTQRLLRGGYVYVYDEANKKWKGYFVSNEACLMEFDIQETFGQSAVKGEHPEKKIPCKPVEYGAIAGCIAVENPEKTDTIWVAFSDTQWTEAVWKKFDANEGGIREKEMRQFNVKQWLASSKHSHACQFLSVTQYVAEYNKDVKTETFGFSPIEFIKKQGYYDFGAYIDRYNAANRQKVAFMKRVYRQDEIQGYWRFISRWKSGTSMLSNMNHSAAEMCSVAGVKYGEKPGPEVDKMFLDCYIAPSALLPAWLKADNRKQMAVLALDDPAGITMDLANLMSERLAAFSGQDQYARQLFASSTINWLKNSVYSSAELKALEEKRLKYRKDIGRPSEEELIEARKYREGFNLPGYEIEAAQESWLPTKLEKLTPEQRAEYDAITLSENEMEKARQDAWRIYSKMNPDPYNPPSKGLSESQEEFEASKAKYEKEYEENRKKPLYDEEAMESFQNTYDEALTAFDATDIKPVADAHVDWMSGEQLGGYFQSRFDPRDLESGKVYTLLFCQCMGDTQDKGACSALYSRWIDDGDIQNQRNLLMRALVLNLDEPAEEIGKAKDEVKKILASSGPVPEDSDKTSANMKKFAEKRESVISTQVGKLFEKVGLSVTKSLFKDLARMSQEPKQYSDGWARAKKQDQVYRLLSNLMGRITSPMVEHMTKWAQTHTFTSFMFCLAGIKQSRFIFLDINAPAKDFVVYALSESASAYTRAGGAPKAISGSLDKIDERLNLMQAQGMNLDTRIRETLAVEINFEAMSAEQRQKLTNMLTGQGHASAPSMEAYLALQSEQWDEAIALLQAQRTRDVSRMIKNMRVMSGKLALTALDAYASFMGMATALKAIKKSYSGTTPQKMEAWARFVAAISSALRTLVDTLVRTINTAWFRLKFGNGLRDAWTKPLTKFGKILGIPAIVVNIAMDAVGAFDAAMKRQYGLFTVRLFSVGLGLVSLWLLSTSCVLFGLGVLIVGIALAGLVSWLEDDPYRDWIGKCVFGKYDSWIRYDDAEKEMKAFQGI